MGCLLAVRPTAPQIRFFCPIATGMLSVTDRKLVSTVFNHATDQTALQQGNLLRVLAWYDNEGGVSNRMPAPAAIIAAQRR